MLRKNLFCAFLLTLSLGQALQALPLPTPTSLPFPINATEDEQDMVREVINLQVYPDGERADLFYFIPPWQVRQYSHGAATMLLNSVHMGFYNEAQKWLKKKEAYSAEKLENMRLDLERKTEGLVDLEKRFQEALERKLEQLIILLGKRVVTATEKLEADTKAYSDAQQLVQGGGTLLPLGLRRDYNSAAIRYMTMSGLNVEHDDLLYSETDAKINGAMNRFANNEGGNLNVNIYAGFSAKQLEALKRYKTKYFPHLNIVLMPMEEITFFPLFHQQRRNNDDNLKGQFFNELKGAGDYLGATISITTSLLGAISMASHLGPFNLPIGINAKFKYQADAIDVNLDCDFSKEFNIDGRDTIRNGVYLFDGPTNLFLMNKENNNNLCTIKVNRGGDGFVEYYVAKTIEERMLALGATLTVVSPEERIAYGKVMQKALNRPYLPPRFWRTDENGYFVPPPSGVILTHYMAPEWFFQAKKVDAANISLLKLKKHIYIKGEEKVSSNLPVNLCLVFNPSIQAYDRCVEIEHESAQSMQIASEEALNSPECKDVSAFECGHLRDKAGRLPEIIRRHESHSLATEI